MQPKAPTFQLESELSATLRAVVAHPQTTEHLHRILGGYCHQARNLLNCLNMSLYLARRDAAPSCQTHWLAIESQSKQVESYLHHLQWLGRPLTIAPVQLPFGLLIDDRKSGWSRQLHEVDRAFLIETPLETVPVRFDPQLLGSALDELLAWRVRLGDRDRDLRLHWATDDADIVLTWDEPSRKSGSVSTPFDVIPQFDALDSLRLPMINRVMALHGGSVSFHAMNPLHLVLRWPRL